MNWKENILESGEQIEDLLKNTKTIAVLGIKTEAQAFQPAFYVPEYLWRAGFEIVPVPVYYPEATEILGRTVYRNLVDIPVEIDLVNVFRRSSDVPKHTADSRLVSIRHPQRRSRAHPSRKRHQSRAGFMPDGRAQARSINEK